MTTSTTTATTSVSSATSLRRPRAVSAAASSTQVDRDHTAASMDSSRGQALVAWLEVRLEEREREKRALIRRRRRHPQIEKSVSFLGLFFLSLSLILFSSFPPPLSKKKKKKNSSPHQANGAPQQKVELREVIREGRPLDVAVAASDLKAGERALSVPETLVVTLSRVFEDGALAELLTTNKLSELACLALFLMYEKKLGAESKWQPFIKELDRIQARGALGAKSPLLWSAEERARLLKGSPLLADAEARVAAVEKEYEELDTVWFMAGSLFNR